MNYNYEDLGQPLQKLLDDLTNLHDIIAISVSGTRMVEKTKEISKLIISIEGETEDKLNKHQLATKYSEIANKQILENFPFLYTQAALMQYSYLEGFIKRLITTFISNNNISTIKEFSNIKINLGDFIGLEEEEKNDYIFQLYEKNLTTGIQYGINRFESLLTPIQLNGKVDKSISKSIFELSQIRNNILHRGGIADRYLIKSCPWLGYTINQPIIINHYNYEKSFKAITDYLSIIAIRIGKKRGKDMSKYETTNCT